MSRIRSSFIVHRSSFLLLLSTCWLVGLSACAFAVPQPINYQGLLTAPDGSPLDTTVAITFALYADSVGGTPLWSETHPDVVVTDGLFNRNIGINEPLPDATLHTSRWIGVTIGGDSELQPRLKIGSVPFARLAGKPDSLTAENVAQLLLLFQSLPDADGDGETKAALGGTDCDDLNPYINSQAAETCDFLDNNCNGEIDEGFQTLWYRDVDEDGYGNDDSTIVSCVPVDGYVLVGGDCHDENAAVNPAAEDVCNFIDDNCDGQVDENGTFGFWYPDLDGDSFGDQSGQILSCPPGPDWVTEAGDCDDSDSTIYPGHEETCDGVDQDCDGSLNDENALGCIMFYPDEDQDGYGALGDPALCFCTPAYPYTATLTGDCDDFDSEINPAAPELCNGIDDNCDGQYDENAVDCTTFYRDSDSDGYGVAGDFVCNCTPQYPYTATITGDCNDFDFNIHPGAPERCNGIDDNCDGFPETDGAQYDCPAGYICVNGVCTQFP